MKTINGHKVRMVDEMGDHAEGSLEVSKAEVRKVLGPPNVEDDPDKVGRSWGFTVDGERCAIWYYKGSNVASTFGPGDLIAALFE